MSQFLRIDVRIVPSGPESEAVAERVSAEVFAAGASGLEERRDGEELHLWIYTSPAARQSVEEALATFSPDEVSSTRASEEPPVDWVARARDQIEPVSIRDRLWIRPSWKGDDPQGHERELVIDPGQAFGTGGHASTRLVLSLLLKDAGSVADRTVLDAGCGSGVLALAALAYGARQAVAFDLDPLAAHATLENARVNGLEEGLSVFCGGVECLEAPPFDVILANLLRRELEPIFFELADRLAPGGRLILAGLLERDRDAVARRGEGFGLDVSDSEEEPDPSGESWLGLVMHRVDPANP